MKKLDLEKSFIKKNNLIISKIENEAVILETNSGIYFKTNKVGIFLIELLEKKSSFENLLEKTSVHFKVSKEKCFIDIDNFLNQLLQKKLIEIIEN